MNYRSDALNRFYEAGGRSIRSDEVNLVVNNSTSGAERGRNGQWFYLVLFYGSENPNSLSRRCVLSWCWLNLFTFFTDYESDCNLVWLIISCEIIQGQWAYLAQGHLRAEDNDELFHIFFFDCKNKIYILLIDYCWALFCFCIWHLTSLFSTPKSIIPIQRPPTPYRWSSQIAFLYASA